MRTSTILRLARGATTLTLCGLLFACASYAPKPLPSQAHWSDKSDLRVDARDIALPALAAQRIDLNAPLTMQTVATLAVLNDPSLQAARDRAGLAQAQAFAAGLLPDPRFSASRDIPQGQSGGATTTAYNLGLSLDLGRLITRGAAVSSARAHLRQVDLQILWQEWQTAAAAEAEDVALIGLRERDAVLGAERDAVIERLQRDRDAVAAGIQPRTTADADLVELQSLQQKLGDDARRHEARLAALDALLGLRPGTPLRLAGLPQFDPDAVRCAAAALDRLSAIRPDLMALQAGYESQEQKLREAVLSQFPSVGVDISRARDTSDVNTVGFGITLSLPILNGSRGAIAVQRATRQALYNDYRLRLRQSRAEAEKILADIDLLRRQQLALQAALPALGGAARATEDALRKGDVTLPQAQAQRLALLDQRLALQANVQQIAEQTVALQLLTGRGVFESAATR
ncbi:MAG: TolC family protein [Betaproteobacteria bacterium]|nr:TolC family protein [Betaproteobacteria bacterium]